MATSITTHPIADLDFPTVTVCPPKGSHTALNYDLMKAEDNSLTIEVRENLKKETTKLFIESPTTEYVRTMVATTNPENIKQTFLGFHSVPRSYGEKKGFEVRMWSNNGSWHTPWFREGYDKNYYEEDKFYTAVLNFPSDLGSHIGGGSLVIKLEVNMREEDGLQEEVSYWEGSKYKLYTEKKTWADAEATCQEEGGHLASVLTEREQEEVLL